MHFTVTDGGDRQIIHLSGRFTSADNDAFLPLMAEIAAKRGAVVEFDLTMLEYVDSFALGLLLVANDEGERNGTRVRFSNLQPAVAHMFELTGMRDLLAVEGSSVPLPPRPRQSGDPAVSRGGRFGITARRNGEGMVLALHGRFTFGEIPIFVDEVAAQAPADRLALDLADLEFLDSAALSAVIIAAETVRTWGGIMVLANPRGRIKEFLELTDVASVVPVRMNGGCHAR